MTAETGKIESRSRIKTRPFGVQILAPLQVVLALISIPSGALLIADPSGTAIGGQFILPYLTASLPFIHDFAPVGMWLVLVYGALPIALAAGLWTRRKWAWYLTMVLGATEIIWIAAEIALFYQFGFFFFYPIIAGFGAASLGLSLLRSVRRYFA